MPKCATLATVSQIYKPALPPGIRDKTFNPSGLSPMGQEPDPYTRIANNCVPHLRFNPLAKTGLTAGDGVHEAVGGIGFHHYEVCNRLVNLNLFVASFGNHCHARRAM